MQNVPGLFFKQVLGRPISKTENLLKILSIESIKPSNLLFVGDEQGDLNAAREFGCHFIGVMTERAAFEIIVPNPVSHIREMLDIIPQPKGPGS